MNGDTLTMGGEGPDLTSVGDYAFWSECQREGESKGDDVDDLEEVRMRILGSEG